MARMPFPMGRQEGEAKSRSVSIEGLINGYFETIPEGKEPAPVYGSPGLTLFKALGAVRPRGYIVMQDVLYVLAGTVLYQVASNGDLTSRGTGVTGTEVVTMATDGVNIVIVTPTSGEIYVYGSVGPAFGPVTDPDAPAASAVAWVDGYFVFSEAGSDRFFISALNDPTSYDALDFASAEWRPDNLVAPIVQRRTLYLFGQSTLEGQFNTGDEFPFQRVTNIAVDVGLIGANAATTTNETIFWIAEDKTVRRLDSDTPTVISTYTIGREIASWADQSLTIASSYVFENHLFIHFWNPNGCVVWDQSTQRWHVRKSYGQETWRGAWVFECYGQLLVLDKAASGNIWTLDPDSYSEGAEPLEFVMTTPFLYNRGERFTTDCIEVMCEPGVGPGDGLSGLIAMETTRDGFTWSAQRVRNMGFQGDRMDRVRFWRCGQSRGIAARFRITDAVKRVIYGTWAEVS
jgi:hypothetical protein